jgi:hypothetical protein
MRALILGLAVLPAVLTIQPRPSAAAYVWYPWCYTEFNHFTPSNCYFNTLAQCKATTGGTGGWCYRNPAPRPRQ